MKSIITYTFLFTVLLLQSSSLWSSEPSRYYSFKVTEKENSQKTTPYIVAQQDDEGYYYFYHCIQKQCQRIASHFTPNDLEILFPQRHESIINNCGPTSLIKESKTLINIFLIFTKNILLYTSSIALFHTTIYFALTVPESYHHFEDFLEHLHLSFIFGLSSTTYPGKLIYNLALFPKNFFADLFTFTGISTVSVNLLALYEMIKESEEHMKNLRANCNFAVKDIKFYIETIENM